jgi:hypothetical protein
MRHEFCWVFCMTRIIAPSLSLLISAVVTVALSGSAAAQLRPDFSGTWAIDETRSVSPAHDAAGARLSVRVQQAAERLVVDLVRGAKVTTLTYAWHGEDLRPATTAEASANRAYWDGDRLVTETIQNINGQTLTTKETRRLANGGSEMIIDRVVEIEHGYSMRGARNSSVGRDVFVRVR